VGWVKLDDGFTMHPKVVGLSLEARWAYVESLCYAARYRTDGVVPDVVAANGSSRRELAAAGLWEIGTAAVRIHDFLVYNPSREEVEALSKERARAGARGGTVAQALARETSEAIAPIGDGTGRVDVGGGGPGEGEFDAFWAVIPRKVGKRTAASAFTRARHRASFEEIMAGAKRFAEDPNRTDEFTPHPTTWLNRDGWADDPLPPRGRKEFPEHPLDAMARRHLEGVSHADLGDRGGSSPAPPRELPGRAG
jgi:hypothetical protein